MPLQRSRFIFSARPEPALGSFFPQTWLRCAKRRFLSHLVPQKTPFLRFPPRRLVNPSSSPAPDKNSFTNLPKIFSSRIMLKKKHFPVCPRLTPARTTQPHVMFKPAFCEAFRTPTVKGGGLKYVRRHLASFFQNAIAGPNWVCIFNFAERRSRAFE